MRMYMYEALYMAMIKVMLMYRGIQESDIRSHKGLAGK